MLLIIRRFILVYLLPLYEPGKPLVPPLSKINVSINIIVILENFEIPTDIKRKDNIDVQ